MTVELEFYYSPYCKRCASSRAAVRKLATSTPGIVFSERNVLQHLEAAAALGVLATPTIAINGKVIMSGAVSMRHLSTRLRQEVSDALHDR